MPSIEECRQSLRDWILTVFDDKQVLIANYNAAQPGESYFTIKLIRAKWYPHNKTTIDSDTEETVNGYVKLFFSIQFIGSTDPQYYLHRLVSSFNSIKGELHFYTAQMGNCGLVGEITDVPEVTGEEWEQRAAMTMTFDAIVPEIFVPEFATSAEITINDDDTITISGD